MPVAGLALGQFFVERERLIHVAALRVRVPQPQDERVFVAAHAARELVLGDRSVGLAHGEEPVAELDRAVGGVAATGEHESREQMDGRAQPRPLRPEGAARDLGSHVCHRVQA